MAPSVRELEQYVGGILQNYLRRNARDALAPIEIRQFAERLERMISRRGLPVPLREGEMGEPGEMSDAEVAPLLKELLADSARAEDLSTPARQLIKGCFHPEFRRCRDSYRERDAEGVCRRQQLKKALARVSGSHCVDCPYWISLTREEHTSCLLRGWAGDPTEFHAHSEIFLPEEFRAFRTYLRDLARKR